MRVVVLGASGLLGRSVADELLDRGHQVVGVSRSGAAGARLLTEGSVLRADLTAAPDAALDTLLDGAGAAVYCLGPDDRAPLPAPASATLDRLLVGATVRCARAAARQQVQHLVILGSYFCTFDRMHPQWELGRRHQYIRARLEQAAGAEAACAKGVVSVLEIPFVFGAVPGVEPMWKPVLFERLRRGPFGATVSGGSAAVRNTDVAGAAAAIIGGRAPAGRYPLAVDNLSYRHLSELVLAEMGRRVPVLTVPAPVLTTGLLAAALAYRVRGRAMGLSPLHTARDILDRDLHLDPVALCAPLGLVPASVDEAIRQTVRAAYPRTSSPEGPGRDGG